MSTVNATSTHCTSAANSQRWCNALLLLSAAAALPVLLAPSKYSNRHIQARIDAREAAYAKAANEHDAARVAAANAAHSAMIAANVANENKRAVLAVIVSLANECAARSCGAWIDTRLRGAIADACKAHAIPTLAGIPHAPVRLSIPHAKADAAIAALDFARAPSVVTWIATDRALATLSRSIASAADLAPARELSMTAPACDASPPPVHRMHSDDVNQLHAGSAGVSKISAGSCPPTYAEAAEKRERRAWIARYRVASLLAKHDKDSRFGRYIRACRTLTSD